MTPFFPPLLFEAALPLSTRAPHPALHCARQGEHFTASWQAPQFLEERRSPLQHRSAHNRTSRTRRGLGCCRTGIRAANRHEQLPPVPGWQGHPRQQGFSSHPTLASACAAWPWYPRQRGFSSRPAPPAEQTSLPHSSGPVSQQSPRKRSEHNQHSPS